MGKGLSAPRMPPLLFPDASRDDPQKRSSRFSLYFHIDAFQFPIFPAPLRFPFIDNLHHTSYFVNQRIKSDVQRNSFRAASPPAESLGRGKEPFLEKDFSFPSTAPPLLFQRLSRLLNPCSTVLRDAAKRPLYRLSEKKRLKFLSLS